MCFSIMKSFICFINKLCDPHLCLNEKQMEASVRFVFFKVQAFTFKNYRDVSVAKPKKSRVCIGKVLFHGVSFLVPLVEEDSTWLVIM